MCRGASGHGANGPGPGGGSPVPEAGSATGAVKGRWRRTRGMSLETMAPTPTWDPDAHEDTVETFRALRDRITVHVWGGDWCPDCRSQLPDVAAALSAAEVPDDAVHEHPVDRQKEGELVAAYDVEYVPTVVVELDGEVAARFVESADRPIAATLADSLAERTEA